MAALITLLLYVLATARMVRLVREDEITRGLRKWWNKHTPAGSLRRYWITCSWCLSIAAALWPASAYVLAPDHLVPRFAAAVLAFSWLAVLSLELHRIAYGKAVMYTPAPAPAPTELPAPVQEA